MTGIYKITNPDNKPYIGRGQDVFKRLRCYRSTVGKGQPDLHESFLKYGIENHKFEIICECEISDMKSFEVYFIKKYDSINNGLNRNANNYYFDPTKTPKEISINYCSSNMIRRRKTSISKDFKKLEGRIRSMICTDSQYKQIKSFLIQLRHRDELKRNLQSTENIDNIINQRLT